MNSYERLASMAQLAPQIRSGEVEVTPIIATGIANLDLALGGGIPLNKLAVFAARTSHGKTATAIRLTANMVAAGRRVRVVWCEDDETEFDLRGLAVLAHEPFKDIIAAHRAGTLDEVWTRVPAVRRERWKNVETLCRERPTVRDVVALIRDSTRNDVVIIDHLNEINWGTGNKWELMGDGLRAIRAAARAARVLVIAMHQLNREWDRRKVASANPERVRPFLSDIENSGQIEQVARVCVIAEKVFKRQGEDEVPTGEYVYWVHKPSLAVARCRWDDRLCTPDNHLQPVRPLVAG